MTTGNKNNIYVVGERKNPATPVPTVSKERMEQALRLRELYIKR